MLIPIYPSKKMQELGEDKRVRLSKSARGLLDTRIKSRAVLEFDVDKRLTPVEKKLVVHKPFIGDIELIEDDLKTKNSFFAFVSEGVYNSLLDLSGALNPSRTVLIGTDPEFCLSNRADNVCCYAAKVLRDTSKIRRFGSDGPCAEVRPNPAGTGLGLVSNIVDCFKFGLETAPDYKWLGGTTHKGEDGRTYTLGGQLHIGEPSDYVIPAYQKVALRPLVIQVLDEVLGVPLTKFEGRDGYTRRTSSEYGNWGDFRISKNRFEWRSVSAVWLLSPALTETVVEIASSVSDALYKRYIEYTKTQDNLMGLSKAIEHFIKHVKRDLLVLNYERLEEYNGFLKDLGNNYKDPSVKSIFDTVLKNVKEMPSKLGITDVQHEFNFLCEVSQFIVKDFKPKNDLKEIWIGGDKDPLIEKTLSEMLAEHKEKITSAKTKLCEITKISDKELYTADFPDNQLEIDDTELSD
jgi:hypothetical protein